jgi:hypothetical protein
VAIVVVGGSGKDVGKTGLVCAIISALRDFEWTAVKITGHDYPESQDHSGKTPAAMIREEKRAGQGTDTGRYLCAGAKRALLVTRAGAKVPIEEIWAALGNDRNVIFESNRIIEVVRPDLCLALLGGDEKKASFERLLRMTDAVISLGDDDQQAVVDGLQTFRLASMDGLPAEMVRWMRERLSRDLTALASQTNRSREPR